VKSGGGLGREMDVCLGNSLGSSWGEDPAMLGCRDANGDDTSGLPGREPVEETDREWVLRMGDLGGRATGDLSAIFDDALDMTFCSNCGVATSAAESKVGIAADGGAESRKEEDCARSWVFSVSTILNAEARASF
jgi:hypothetical protein